MRELTPAQAIERSITKTYRDTIWNPFIRALKQYELLQEGDRVAVCISGGKDSMLLAKLMQMLRRYSDFPFELTYLVMNPGYTEANMNQIKANAALMEIPITVFETNIFDVADRAEKYPCYLCARMRRGCLYKKARELGCSKIALGHHFDDVIETTVMSMFYGSQLQGMIPKLHSTHYEGMELIRPLYCVREEDILRWCRYNDLRFIRCACRVTERIAHSADGVGESKRQEIKLLIKELSKTNPNLPNSIFNAVHDVHLDTFPGYRSRGEEHTFLDKYNLK
jgi:tRNA(Ile)-lysidine synthase TilS/MesJ